MDGNQRVDFREPLLINDLAKQLKLAGHGRINAGVLRMWQLRYGWPTPIRGKNDYRYYPPYLCQQILEFGECIAKFERQNQKPAIGKLIAEFLDGKGWPGMPKRVTAAPKFLVAETAPDMTCVEEIERLRSFFAHGDQSNIVAALHQYQTWRPYRRAYLYTFIKSALTQHGDFNVVASEFKSLELSVGLICNGVE